MFSLNNFDNIKLNVDKNIDRINRKIDYDVIIIFVLVLILKIQFSFWFYILYYQYILI